MDTGQACRQFGLLPDVKAFKDDLSLAFEPPQIRIIIAQPSWTEAGPPVDAGIPLDRKTPSVLHHHKPIDTVAQAHVFVTGMNTGH